MSFEGHPPSFARRTDLVDDDGGGKEAAEPWKPDGPYNTKNPEGRTTPLDDQARKVSDARMCESWRSQINVMTILAGVYTYTATTLTLQTSKWLRENPASALARLQLQSQSNTDPGGRAAPVVPPFKASASAVFINAVFVASLALSLAAFALGLLCRQWLAEYERCATPAAREACLARGVRCPGLRAWRAPTVVAFLPVLLQGVVVLFFVGIHVLVWAVHPLVGSFVAVGSIVVFLGVAAVLCPVLMWD